jgi:hypothetical protein
MFMRSVLFWNITKRRVVILYRRFGTKYRSHFQGPRSPCPETSVKDCHSTLRNVPEERRSQDKGYYSVCSLTRPRAKIFKRNWDDKRVDIIQRVYEAEAKGAGGQEEKQGRYKAKLCYLSSAVGCNLNKRMLPALHRTLTPWQYVFAANYAHHSSLASL